ncbi:sulfite exporter TauE/SafE family protein [Aestuariivirga sp.]|uniref:sulfite exporter TauE/SafE family protein n=1 Tax=Aestuariivirga sp. TaxID=2650926 RepID=UPI0035935EC5
MSPRLFYAFCAGAVVGTLGGLIGLGGAEFRLPILIGFFGFGPLIAVILNKAMSLVVVASSLPFRTGIIPLSAILEHWPVIVNLLAGSLLGAWSGASWALRLKTSTFYIIISVLLIAMAAVLLVGHGVGSLGHPALQGIPLLLAGVIAGFGIGVVSSLMGVAGGELLIPTLVLLYGIDVKLAGSLSLVVSLPTMITGFLRYSRDDSFKVLKSQWSFCLSMASGSLLGAFLGAQLLHVVDARFLLPSLSVILLISAWKVARHARGGFS